MHMQLMKRLVFHDCRWNFYFFHSGSVILNEIGICDFVGMKRENFLVNEFPTLEELIGLGRERLGWMEASVDVHLEG